MKAMLLAPCLCLGLLPLPALADPPHSGPPPSAPPPSSSPAEEGLSLMEEGARLLLRGLIAEVEPQMQDMTRDMARAWDTAGPEIARLMALMGDIGNYHLPEMLENGDILIRRKTPAELKLEGLSGPQTDL